MNLTLYNAAGKILGSIPRSGNVYSLRRYSADTPHALSAQPANTLSLLEVHQMYSHSNYAYIKKMIESGQLKHLKIDPARMAEEECLACALGKAKRAVIPKVRQTPLAVAFGDLMHMDIWGPASTQTIGHKRYTLTIVDDASRWLHMPLMCHKSDAYAAYVAFQTFLQTQFGITIKQLQSDNDGSFLSEQFQSFLTLQGTLHRRTTHDTPQQNGAVERVHGSIFNAVRTSMVASDLPRWTWGESLSYVVFLYNRLPHATLNFKSPYEVRFGTLPPDMARIKPFGAKCAVRLEHADKLSPRAEVCRYVGPDLHSLGHRIYWPSQRKISVERNVDFAIPGEQYTPQEDFLLEQAPENDKDDIPPEVSTEPTIEEPSSEDEEPAPPPPTRRSARKCTSTKKKQGIAFFSVDTPEKQEAREKLMMEAFLATGGTTLLDEREGFKGGFGAI